MCTAVSLAAAPSCFPLKAPTASRAWAAAGREDAACFPCSQTTLPSQPPVMPVLRFAHDQDRQYSLTLSCTLPRGSSSPNQYGERIHFLCMLVVLCCRSGISLCVGHLCGRRDVRLEQKWERLLTERCLFVCL